MLISKKSSKLILKHPIFGDYQTTAIYIFVFNLNEFNMPSVQIKNPYFQFPIASQQLTVHQLTHFLYGILLCHPV